MANVTVPLLPSWIRWIGVFVIGGVIFYLSIIPVPSVEPIVSLPGPLEVIQLDKWLHFIGYAALGYALAYATVDWNQPDLSLAFSIVGITIFYGFGIELIQSVLPYREFSINDTYANAFGGFLVFSWFLIRPHLDFRPVLLRY